MFIKVTAYKTALICLLLTSCKTLMNAKKADEKVNDAIGLFHECSVGMSSGHAFTIYVTGVVFCVAGAFLIQSPFKRMAIGSFSAGGVCFVAPSIIKMFDSLGREIELILTWCMWGGALMGLIFIIYRVKRQMSVNQDLEEHIDDEIIDKIKAKHKYAKKKKNE